MKKLLIIIAFLLIPINVIAYTGPLDEQYFYINNQTTSPFTINVNANSSTNVTFHLVDSWNHGSGADYDLVGSYLFFSIVSNQPIDINRRYSYGTNCNQSCFSNDDYLQLIDDTNGYSYVYYFNIVKWAVNVGTQIDLYNVDDQFTFVNKGSSSATIYVYGSYADTTNQIPQYINNTNTTQQIIIDGQTNRDMIIDNQNDNTDKIIGLFNNCDTIDRNSSGFTNLKFLRNNGEIGNSQYYGVTDYINISSAKVEVITPFTVSDSGTYLCYYTQDKTLISCQNIYNLTSLTIPNNSYYLRTSVFTYNTNNSPILKVCTNSNQVIIDKQDVTNDKLDDLNDNMTDSSIDNPNSDLSDISDMVAENGVITQLIVLPITLYSAVLNTINGQCSDYVFGSLFGTELKMTCVNVSNLLGSTLYNTIDIIISGLFVFGISKKMIKVFNNMSSLKEGDVIGD